MFQNIIYDYHSQENKTELARPTGATENQSLSRFDHNRKTKNLKNRTKLVQIGPKSMNQLNQPDSVGWSVHNFFILFYFLKKICFEWLNQRLLDLLLF